MARSRTPKRPPKEDAPVALASEAPPPPPTPEERRIGVNEYVTTARLSPMHGAILAVLHPATKATRSEWAAHLDRALNRPVP